VGFFEVGSVTNALSGLDYAYLQNMLQQYFTYVTLTHLVSQRRWREKWGF